MEIPKGATKRIYSLFGTNPTKKQEFYPINKAFIMNCSDEILINPLFCSIVRATKQKRSFLQTENIKKDPFSVLPVDYF